MIRHLNRHSDGSFICCRDSEERGTASHCYGVQGLAFYLFGPLIAFEYRKERKTSIGETYVLFTRTVNNFWKYPNVNSMKIRIIIPLQSDRRTFSKFFILYQPHWKSAESLKKFSDLNKWFSIRENNHKIIQDVLTHSLAIWHMRKKSP